MSRRAGVFGATTAASTSMATSTTSEPPNAVPLAAPSDTIRILVSTDNHVGYEERDPIRKDDGSRTFDEIMQLARTHDVDMVLLGGDLFHDNKPSRQAMYQVMRSLRQNCLGDRPCELEFLSDPHTVFEGAFPFANYEDQDINVSIPVFSIHGNHDDPSGEGHLCSLDLLHCGGLVNYYGRIGEADRIEARPVLLQKGSTRLALYGLSNVRDERMFRTFRDGHVKWFRPSGGRNGAAADDADASPWFNLLAVHQNHHAHTTTSYLPESVLPSWMNLVVWGHEHECIIEPKLNPETGFYVMQPGSSIATSLAPGEAVTKHVALVEVADTRFRSTKIPLMTVRPMVVRELALAKEVAFRKLATVRDNRSKLSALLASVVDDMIAEARREWAAHHDDSTEDDCPLPLVRLRVDYTPPDDGHGSAGAFEIENPQRFSSRFAGRVANTTNIVQFHQKKKASLRAIDPDMPEDATLGANGRRAANGEDIKVEDLVHNFLTAQSLRVFPQVPFGDAVHMYVTKDDRTIMDAFVDRSVETQVAHIIDFNPQEGQDTEEAMKQNKAVVEAMFENGMVLEKANGDAMDVDKEEKGVKGGKTRGAKSSRGKAQRGGRRGAVKEDDKHDVADDIEEEEEEEEEAEEEEEEEEEEGNDDAAARIRLRTEVDGDEDAFTNMLLDAPPEPRTNVFPTSGKITMPTKKKRAVPSSFTTTSEGAATAAKGEAKATAAASKTAARTAGRAATGTTSRAAASATATRTTTSAAKSANTCASRGGESTLTQSKLSFSHTPSQATSTTTTASHRPRAMGNAAIVIDDDDEDDAFEPVAPRGRAGAARGAAAAAAAKRKVVRESEELDSLSDDEFDPRRGSSTRRGRR